MKHIHHLVFILIWTFTCIVSIFSHASRSDKIIILKKKDHAHHPTTIQPPSESDENPLLHPYPSNQSIESNNTIDYIADDYPDRLHNEVVLHQHIPTKNQELSITSLIGKHHDKTIHNVQTLSPENNSLILQTSDIRLEKSENSHIDLYVKKKPSIHSILLTNYYWKHKKSSKAREYGLRSLDYNPINGNEQRLYKNHFIGKKQGLFFLVDSSAQPDAIFGQAFHIRIPQYIVYGYQKNQEIYRLLRVKHGLRFNIRTFSRKYADYKGQYQDTPAVIMLRKHPTMQARPIITKIKEHINKNYMEVHVEYESKEQFFKTFLIRGEKDSNYRTIRFSDTQEHESAILLEAFYQDGVGRVLKAIIHLKRNAEQKTYFITALDRNGFHAVGQIQVTVPPHYYYADNNEKEQFYQGNMVRKNSKWYDNQLEEE